MHLSPRDLKVLVTVARTLSFSRTAELFFLTQPTLTKIVHDIEGQVGVQIFERTTRSVRLTRDGEEIVPVALQLLQDYENGISDLEGIARRRRQRIAVAALPTLAAMLLPAAVADLQRDIPDLILKVHDVQNDAALELLKSRQVDLALTAADRIAPDLSYEEIVREPFVALVPAKGPSNVPDRWLEVELQRLPIITMPRGASTRTLVEARFVEQGIPFRPFLEVQNLCSIARFVKAGCGTALLPLLGALLVADDDLRIIRLEGAPERSVGVVTRIEAEQRPLVQRVLAVVRREANFLSATLR